MINEERDLIITELKLFRKKLKEMEKIQTDIEHKNLIGSIIYEVTKIIIKSYGG